MGGKRNNTRSSSDHNLDEIADLKRIIDSQNAAIQKLTSRVNVLEGKMCRMEGELVIAKHVSSILEEKLDENQQYSRRSCLLISGIMKNAPNEHYK